MNMSGESILVIRMSAMGDVALTLPVIRAVSESREIVVVTRPLFAEFFINIPGVKIFVADTNNRHKGFVGIIRLFSDIRREHKVRLVVDLHDVIRSRLLSLLFRFAGAKISRIDKGRAEKRRFIKEKSTIPLLHTTERYATVFNRAGISVRDIAVPCFMFSVEEEDLASEYIDSIVTNNSLDIVGIAPFARHETKQWQTPKVSQLIELINSFRKVNLFLFGAPDERPALNEIARGFDNVFVVNDSSGLREELAIIARLKTMICMDSSNMHLAAIAGVRTVSIWGGTHPDTGFAPIGKQPHLQVGIPLDELECRPCTVYGRGPCLRDDLKYRCMHDISALTVFEAMKAEGFI